jgi:hypothetical protein
LFFSQIKTFICVNAFHSASHPIKFDGRELPYAEFGGTENELFSYISQVANGFDGGMH